ncbi:MAG: helix-turn-helix transcriptional regulator [Deltaproteobacteria bacterium]|nr:helix-turn-helix transcriptional regulator [Deltaproteobacteria bacterium]
MQGSVIFKKKSHSFIDIAQAAISAHKPSDIGSILIRTKNLINADFAIGALGIFDRGSRVDNSHFTNLHSTEEWIYKYLQQNLLNNDPLIFHITDESRLSFWPDFSCSKTLHLEPTNPSPFPNYSHGKSLSIIVGGDIKSILFFSKNSGSFQDHQKILLELISPHIHQAYLKLHNESKMVEQTLLSKREKEVLHWMRYGKTSWETSIILQISERTAKFHIQNIIRKLNASNKTHAVAIALERGLI